MKKEQFQLEFPITSSTSLLFEYMASADGLSEWFADEVIESDDDFKFSWNGAEETAHILKFKTEAYIRLRWEEDENTDYYFEMSIQKDEITNDVALIVTDFSEPDELEENKLYWSNLVEDLKDKIGG